MFTTSSFVSDIAVAVLGFAVSAAYILGATAAFVG